MRPGPRAPPVPPTMMQPPHRQMTGSAPPPPTTSASISGSSTDPPSSTLDVPPSGISSVSSSVSTRVVRTYSAVPSALSTRPPLHSNIRVGARAFLISHLSLIVT